jgi:hypothetical protein
LRILSVSSPVWGRFCLDLPVRDQRIFAVFIALGACIDLIWRMDGWVYRSGSGIYCIFVLLYMHYYPCAGDNVANNSLFLIRYFSQFDMYRPG